jgi:hypothetical protein
MAGRARVAERFDRERCLDALHRLTCPDPTSPEEPPCP